MSENSVDFVPPTSPNRQRQNQHRNIFGDADTMERLFHALFFRLALIYSRAVPKHIRRLAETTVLIMSLFSLGLLVYIHLVFNRRPIDCLSHLQDVWPRDGVVRIELFMEEPSESYDLHQSYVREFHYHFPQAIIEPNRRNQTETMKNELDVESTENLSNSVRSSMSENVSTSNENIELSENVSLNLNNSNTSNDGKSRLNKSHNYLLLDLHWLKYFLVEEQPILEYSLEYGFLRLSEATRQRLNITVLYIKLDLTNSSCFGDGLTKFLFDQVIGYQEVLMTSIKQLAEKENQKGYVRNVFTNDHYRFINSNEKRRLWSYTIAFIVMLIFTVSISMLLRYSHFQIFIFIIDLLRMIEQNGSIVFPAAPLLTVILALIGMEAVMSEFFNDTSTAFYVIIIVWIADQYETICCHMINSKRHWVRFFYLYHFTFYLYHARYNGQHSGLALTTSCCFIFHSMLYFFHHIELPVIEAHIVEQESN